VDLEFVEVGADVNVVGRATSDWNQRRTGRASLGARTSNLAVVEHVEAKETS